MIELTQQQLAHLVAACATRINIANGYIEEYDRTPNAADRVAALSREVMELTELKDLLDGHIL